MQICGTDAVDLLLLAVVGNFVSVPGESTASSQSSLETMPSVAIDARTGQLVSPRVSFIHLHRVSLAH